MTVWEALRIEHERPTDRRAFQILYTGAFYGDLALQGDPASAGSGA